MPMLTGQALHNCARCCLTVPDDHPLYCSGDSIDLRVGRFIATERHLSPSQRVHILKKGTGRELFNDYEHLPVHGVTLKPGQLSFVQTLEQVSIPEGVYAVITLRAWAAKSGLQQTDVLTLKPGWRGAVPLGLVNMLQHHELLLIPGTSIWQLQLFAEGDLDRIARQPVAAEAQVEEDVEIPSGGRTRP